MANRPLPLGSSIAIAGAGIIGASAAFVLAERGYRREYGARELRRTLKIHVETPLTDLMLDGTVKEGMTVRVKTRSGDIVFDPQTAQSTSPVAAV